MYRALIVDDIDVIRNSIAAQVDDLQSNVAVSGTAENGEKALEWLDTHYADICITDIRMPVTDGLELVKSIRKRYPWMVTLIVSSYDEFEYARTSIQLEVVDYILKPVDDGNLEAALKKSVEKIQKDRLSRAASLIFSHMSECSPMMEKWCEYLKISTGDCKDIINETVKKLCEIVEENYYLLDFLAEEWVNRISCELKLDMSDLNTGPLEKRGFEQKIIYNSVAKQSFIHACTEKLAASIDILKSEFSGSRINQQSRVVEQIKKYVNENYTRSDFTLQELADNIMFSKNHMTNIFKQETGMTIWNYIIDLRMKKAKELLAGSMSKTLEVAMSVGYNNYNHFSQLFKEYCGVSANEYRKSVQGRC